MILAALFSGGKDSTFSIYQAQLAGHQIKCLVTILPKSDESHLLHHPNISQTKFQSKSMKIPQIINFAKNNESDVEELELDNLIKTAKKTFEIEGIVHGGIHSEYQKNKFEMLNFLQA